MALTDEGTSTTMLVQPSGFGGYGNNMFGGDWAWIILLLLAFGGGWGMGGFGGFGGGMWGADGLYPWLNNSQNINGGFRDQMLNTTLTGIQNSVTSGFGDIQTALCGGFAGVNATINGAANGLSQQLNANQMANLQQLFGVQSALQNCCCENRANIADLKYTIANEACATRANSTANTQAILDKLCALELDGVKGQLAQAQRENVALQNAVNMANMQASQVAQTAQILAGQTAEVDALYNRLSNCPVPSTPVYGRQPIFTCNNGGCGCGVA